MYADHLVSLPRRTSSTVIECAAAESTIGLGRAIYLRLASRLRDAVTLTARPPSYCARPYGNCATEIHSRIGRLWYGYCPRYLDGGSGGSR